MEKSQVLSSLQGLSAVITGGSSGLGLATAERLSKLGCTVAILDFHEPKELPTNCYFIKTDVTKEQDLTEAMEIIENKSKKIDILVNCAGIFKEVVFNAETQTPHNSDLFKHILEVNTTGTFNMIRLCCPFFYKNEPNVNQQRGVIINTASICAIDGMMSSAAYSASKAAVAGMTLPLAIDLANMGIRVMTIAPGFFQTPMTNGFEIDFPNWVPFPKRFGQPDEFAHLVQAIIENPMLNGEVIRLDAAFRFSAIHNVNK